MPDYLFLSCCDCHSLKYFSLSLSLFLLGLLNPTCNHSLTIRACYSQLLDPHSTTSHHIHKTTLLVNLSCNDRLTTLCGQSIITLSVSLFSCVPLHVSLSVLLCISACQSLCSPVYLWLYISLFSSSDCRTHLLRCVDFGLIHPKHFSAQNLHKLFSTTSACIILNFLKEINLYKHF